MAQNFKQRKQAGFTIIEVMIVLAIAALILLVVLLAVPALQRSSRNNATQTSVGNILTAVSNAVANNNGILPTTPNKLTAPGSDGTVAIGGATGYSGETAATSNSSIAQVVIDNGSKKITAKSDVGTVEVVTGANATCNANANDITGATASTRSIVALYVAESGSGNIVKCVTS